MTDGLDAALDDAVPKCLVLLDVDEESGLIYLECPVCKDVFM